jgi:zinc protease
VERPSVPLPKLEAGKRLVYEDRVQVPRLYIQWPTVGVKNDDNYALSVLSSIMTGSRTARLTKALVYDSQKASQVFGFQNGAEDVGVFQVTVVPRPEATLTELEAMVDQVVQKFITEGPTAEELQKAKSGLELNFLRGLESNLGKAEQLISGSVFYGNPGHFSTAYQKTLAVTAADVKRVASQYLSRSRVVLSIVPKGKKDKASKATESEVVTMVVGKRQGGRS